MEITNPYIAGSPVKNTEMFFGREDVFEFVEKALRGRHRDNVIVLYGQRRTGKTSVLYQMHRHMGDEYLCLFIDLHGLALDGINGFVWELANYIKQGLRNNYDIELPRLQRAQFGDDARQTFENDFLPQVWDAIGNRHILLMLDEAVRLQEQVKAGKIEKEVFNYLRHLMQHFDQLIFLFSLGSGLEEMEKEYALLFSVALYKKISFLEMKAAEALINDPVMGQFRISPQAVGYILELTSGHPYFIQLICHSLFTSWQQNPKETLGIEDVNLIIEEVVERGLAVLKFNWEESTAREKAFLTGLAKEIYLEDRAVTVPEVKQSWNEIGAYIPTRELSNAVKILLSRDIIVGREGYRFAVDLQRIWIGKYKRQEWVQDEIASSIDHWRQEKKKFNLLDTRAPWFIWVAIIVVLIMFVLLGYLIRPITDDNARTAQTANALAIVAGSTAVAANSTAKVALTQAANAGNSIEANHTAQAALKLAEDAMGTADAASTKVYEAQATATLTSTMMPIIQIVDHMLVDDEGIQFRYEPAASSNFSEDTKLDPRYLIFHNTTGTNVESSLNYFRNPISQASTHILIDRDGSIIQIVPFDKMAFHAGLSEWQGLQNLNPYSIGIQLDNAGSLRRTDEGWKRRDVIIPDEQVVIAQHKNESFERAWEKYTNAQLEAALNLAKVLVGHYGIEDILGHYEISPETRLDPGPAFPIEEFRKEIFGREEPFTD